MGSNSAKNEKMDLETPKKPMSRATFAQGYENVPKRCPKTQKDVFEIKAGFCAQNHFLRQNEKMSEKVPKW